MAQCFPFPSEYTGSLHSKRHGCQQPDIESTKTNYHNNATNYLFSFSFLNRLFSQAAKQKLELLGYR